MGRVASDIRLPGVYFLPPPREAVGGLPRLDVAGFVGFAAQGPLHTPVRVDDARTYADVFGGDLPLAREPGGRTVRANLPAAVADFFANGGRRCYVVRVAGGAARSARFRLPGVVAIGEAGAVTVAASLPASSPGRWSGALRLGTRLAAAPLPRRGVMIVPGPAGSGETLLRWPGVGGADAVRPGNVLRLRFDTGQTWLAPVIATTPAAGGDTAATITLGPARRLWAAADLDAPGQVPESGIVERLGIDTEPGSAGAASLEVTARQFRLSVTGDGADTVAAGDVLRIRLGNLKYLFSVADLLAVGHGVDGPTATVAIDQLLAEVAEPLPDPAGLRRAERLRLDLLIRYGSSHQQPVRDLDFNAGQERFFGVTASIESSPRFARAADAVARRSRPGGTTALGHPRHTGIEADPLGGDSIRDPGAVAALAAFVGTLTPGEAGRTFLPVGLGDVFDATRFVGPAADHQGDDGLEAFDPAAFFDEELLDKGNAAAALNQAAFDRRFVRGLPLRGLHALTYEGEVALVSLPDATHRPWPGPAEVPPPPPPTLPPEPEPDRSQFDDCAPGAAEAPGPRPPAPPAPPPDVLDLPMSTSAADYDRDVVGRLIEAHRHVLRFCQARADVLGVLTLPSHFRTAACVAWQERLRTGFGLPPRTTLADEVRDVANLSYVAVYHPWLHHADAAEPDGLRAVPPDGAICGTIAARERNRGAWIAPANLPLRGVLGLSPALPAADLPDLFDRRFNVIARTPVRGGGDFRAISAHTLGDGRELLQVSVRRLMILLRKVAEQRGALYVFEPNNRDLAETVRAGLDGMLRSMFDRGAFAGDTPQQSYRVITDATVNTRQSMDLGRFIAVVKVAPSQPLEFLTVVLTRDSGGAVTAVEG